MAKFTLIIWVCSFLGGQPSCLPPIEYPKKLNSWYECSRTAHQESLVLISKMGFKYINDNKVAIKYSCVEGAAV
tara:strand:- start:5 stop:226 length:222 start_codon:yes stop_codon:yes gene_type:complete